jgi:hypothetical protein
MKSDIPGIPGSAGRAEAGTLARSAVFFMIT